MSRWMETHRLATIALICVYLVIIAGSIVRVTGSGMGCPDWPRCFGYMIPPVDQETLTLSPAKKFLKGQMVIHHDTLWVSKEEFVMGDEVALDRTIWSKYPKHDYAIFNPVHTWIEYINRLLTALLGLPVLLLFLMALREARREGRWTVAFWSGLTLVFMLYEAWLGKLVVDGELSNGKVTLHMLGSIGIVWALMMARTKAFKKQNPRQNLPPKWWLLGLFLVLIQMILGTQLREVVDQVIKNGWERNQWMEQVVLSSERLIFYTHRTFSWVLVIYLFWISSKLLKMKRSRLAYGLMMMVAVEVLVGVMLNYFDFPAFAQPLHLVLSFGLFGALLHGFLSKSTSVSQ